jgi:putative intracellular protease/amidase
MTSLSTHLTERGHEVEFASPRGGAVTWTPFSDPYGENTTEPDDLVSKGFLSDPAPVDRLRHTQRVGEVELAGFDAVHVAGGQGATYDLYPNDDVARALEHFWSNGKVVGAICHGAIALGNIADRVRGRKVTGYSLEGDRLLEAQFGPTFLIPSYPQEVLEKTGASYSNRGPYDPYVIDEGKLVTGQNQQSASEYAIVLLRSLTGDSPVAQARGKS